MDEAEWYHQESRRRTLAAWGGVLIAFGMAVVLFAIAAGIAIGIQPEIRNETFAVVTTAIAVGAMPYAIAGTLLVGAGFLARAILSGPAHRPPVATAPPPPRARTY